MSYIKNKKIKLQAFLNDLPERSVTREELRKKKSEYVKKWKADQKLPPGLKPPRRGYEFEKS